MQRSGNLSMAAFLVAASISSAYAQTTVTATNSGQIGKHGPGFSSEFLDVEGPANGSFATFGVLDFTNISPGFIAGSVNPDLTLNITDAPYQYTSPGTLDFYLVTNNTTSIVGGTGSPLKYMKNTNPVGLGTQLGTNYFLGAGSYTSTAASSSDPGAVFTYNLQLPNAAAEAYFLSQINSPTGDIRIAITADPTVPNPVPGFDPNLVTATFAGATNGFFDANAPTLTFTAVPEPSAWITFMAGLTGLAVVRPLTARRRKRS